ncbi:MAG: AMP-binding protein [Oscillospiraceae bacterium]|nr:AMP-binding protein [Oscillospiraceae bacterium]
MIAFLKQISDACQRFPERPAIVDRDGARTTDYRSLNELSGRVASYLKTRGIGLEDVVALLLPKGMEHIAARIAMMKAGAAWVSLADSMGTERVRYAVRECRCALEFTVDRWQEAMRFEALDESAWADSAPHDLAFIIYTSGSTGTPKGAMQEYGIYERISAGTHGMLDPYMPTQFGHIIPEVFVGGVYITVGLLQDGGTIHVLSPEMTRDPAALLGYLKKRGITATFVPPALARVLQRQDGLSLRVVFVGGEIVSQVSSDRCDSMNIYGPSEFGHPACLYRFGHAMDNTPVGRPIPGTEAILITETGEETDREGILCAALPFFRGYVSDREQTPFVFLRGKRWFVSGDLARQDADGCYTILGRTDRMINLNGNRVDPAEVESAFKKAFPVSQAAAKPFSLHGRNCLCLFYAGTELSADAAVLSERLKAYLPTYMIPSVFVKLPALPLSSAGKLDYDRLSLPDALSAPYVAPEGPVEAALCRAVAKALELDGQDPGVNDDFFELGGDSLTAMRLLMESELPGLDIACIYRCRTVRRMAAELRALQAAVQPQTAECRPLPLLPYQMLYVRRAPKGLSLVARNVAGELLFRPGTDPGRLARAVEQAVRAHSALSTGILLKDGQPVQVFSGGMPAPVVPVCQDYAALRSEEASFLAPFSADGSPLFRARLSVTERGCVLWLNAHHSICDGESLVVLIRDILSAYRGELPEPDDYPAFLLSHTSVSAIGAARRTQEYLEALLRGLDFVAVPEPDRAAAAEAGKATAVQQVLRTAPKEVSLLAKRCGVSVSALYTALAVLTLGLYRHAGRVLITWTWNGRRDRESMRRVGLMLQDLILCQDLPDDMPAAAFCRETARQRDRGIGASGLFFPDGSIDEPAGLGAEGLTAPALCFVHQNYLSSLSDEPLLFAFRQLESGDAEAEEALELDVWEGADGVELELYFNRDLYSPDRMRAFLRLYASLLEELCLDPELTVGRLRERFGTGRPRD